MIQGLRLRRIAYDTILIIPEHQDFIEVKNLLVLKTYYLPYFNKIGQVTRIYIVRYSVVITIY